MTVGLALLAYDLAGADAGVVIGTALAIKMIVYVGVSPIAAGFAAQFSRRKFLVVLDLLRAGTAIALPFVDAVWQIYVLIAVLQMASAGFTPVFQATIPDILPEEKDYTNALSLSRFAYDLENLLSPAIAAVLVGLIGFQGLFSGTVIGFFLSASLIFTVTLPAYSLANSEPPLQRTAKGLRIYLRTPRLRGLLGLNLVVSAAGAIVIVNTVVFIKEILGKSDVDLAIAMAAYGGGSMAMALTIPRLLLLRDDRTIMITAAAFLPLLLLVFAALVSTLPTYWIWPALLMAWILIGGATSAVLVPTGRLLRNSAQPNDRPMVFAAQFALSHGCWLITYPLAGWLGSAAGLSAALYALALIAIGGVVFAHRQWPADDDSVIAHNHPELPSEHPHLTDAAGKKHAHPFVIDDLHTTWPSARP
jgi:predicted MFS family arabinose efflux permease